MPKDTIITKERKEKIEKNRTNTDAGYVEFEAITNRRFSKISSLLPKFSISNLLISTALLGSIVTICSIFKLFSILVNLALSGENTTLRTNCGF